MSTTSMVFSQIPLSLFSNFMLFFRVGRMAGYSIMEDGLLCGAWLTVSADFVGRSRGGIYWQYVHDSFHGEKHIASYGMHIIINAR